MTEGMSDPTILVNRWRRYGKDRLYVTRPDETKIGWWDLSTDDANPETPEDLPTLTAAVAGWKAENLDPAGPWPLLQRRPRLLPPRSKR